TSTVAPSAAVSASPEVPQRPSVAARRAAGGLAVLRRAVSGAGPEGVPGIRPSRRNRDRQGWSDPRRGGGEHHAARFRLHGDHALADRRPPRGDRGAAAARHRQAGAERGRDIRLGGHHEPRTAVGQRAPARRGRNCRGLVRALYRGYGWGIASFTSLDQLPVMVTRAHQLSRAVRLEEPIRLANVAPQQAEVLLDLDGDVRGVPLSEKKRLLEAYNGAM